MATRVPAVRGMHAVDVVDEAGLVRRTDLLARTGLGALEPEQGEKDEQDVHGVLRVGKGTGVNLFTETRVHESSADV